MPNILESLECVISALNSAKVRYLIAGGLAVNAHGYTRATHDIDLVVQLNHANANKALSALGALGYLPLAPVALEDFANDTIRNTWITQKGLSVFGLVSNQHPQAPVDIFVTEPFLFDQEYDSALVDELSPGLEVRFVSLATLLNMKKQVARPKDLDDIENLSLL